MTRTRHSVVDPFIPFVFGARAVDVGRAGKQRAFEVSRPTGGKEAGITVLFLARHCLCPLWRATGTSPMSVRAAKGKEDYGQRTTIGGLRCDQTTASEVIEQRARCGEQSNELVRSDVSYAQ